MVLGGTTDRKRPLEEDSNIPDMNSDGTQTSPLQALAASVSVNARIITDFCNDHSFAHRSLGTDGPSTLLPPNAPKEVRLAQQSLLDAAWELQLLATDKSELIGRYAVQNNQLGCLRWLCHFRIPLHVPPGDGASYADVARAAGVPEGQLKSIARMAMLNHFFYEPQPDRLAHTSTSINFLNNPDMLDWALFFTGSSAPMASKMVEATEKWGQTEAKNHTAYNIAMDTDLNIFQHVAQSPSASKQYGGYMKNLTMSEGVKIHHLIHGFDWASLGKATVVDLGGSSGHASIAIAKAFPELSFIVQDLPDTIASFKDGAVALPPNVASRITYLAQDFFLPQPQTVASVADAYLLRMIIHDWRDKESTTILHNAIEALKQRPQGAQGGRFIIMDTVLPRPGSLSRTQEAALRVRDLTMLQAHNAKERELPEWVDLLARIDPALRLRRVVQPFGSVMAVLDVEYDAEAPATPAGTLPSIETV